MRLVAEEKKTGTLELLVTLPVSDLAIIVGKLLGAVGFLVVALLLTLVFPALVLKLGSPDLGALVGGYIGLLLIGTTFLALGVMTSTWTHNQIVAFILGLLLCVFFWTATDSLIKLAFEQPPMALQLLTFKSQFAAFAKGVVDIRNVFYFLSVTAVAVVASTYMLKSRNWK
jgi:ABC-2 type transport system permease protein